MDLTVISVTQSALNNDVTPAPADVEQSLSSVDLCRSEKDETGGSAEAEPWPRAACSHQLTVMSQRQKQP